jgi:hypothetical protein
VSGDEFNEIIALADEAARQCDRLIELPDCFQDYDQPPTDLTKALPLPADLEKRAPNLQMLSVDCSTDAPPPGGKGYCKAPPFLKYKSPRQCAVTKDFGKWPDMTHKKDEQSVFVPRDPACAEPWAVVAVFRFTPKRRQLEVGAAFLRNDWLAEHGGAARGGAAGRSSDR